MVEKKRIVADLGVDALLLHDTVNRALVANDRAKFLFSLLQAATDRADHPDRPAASLRSERLACGLADEALDGTVANSRGLAGDRYYIPGVGDILGALLGAVGEMVEAVEAGRRAGVDVMDGFAETARRRFAASAARRPETEGNVLAGSFVRKATSGERDQGDSLHILVMDLHKALNALQVAIAEEVVDGASVYHLEADDYRFVRAFMRGVNRTAPLKFSHPGLATTATRMEGRLVIQNDIGTTDAHVLVLAVEGLAATVTYSDVHPRRLAFFQNALGPFQVTWNEAAARRGEDYESGIYYVSIGRFEAASPEELERYLAFLGSRLVFLIDWNKARKRLVRFVSPAGARGLLVWAAQADVGHRGFLELGGERLVYEAIDYAARAQVRYGETLEEMLGEEQALEYLRFVLRTATEGLLAGRSERLIRDEVKTALIRFFHAARETLLGIAADHATFIFEIAGALRDVFVHAPSISSEVLAQTARRAASWEKKADALVNQARALSRRQPGSDERRMLLEEADDAADSLEEAAYLMTLLADLAPAPATYAAIGELAAIAAEGAQEYVKCVANASHIERSAVRDDVDDFLRAVDGVARIEHAADESLRRATGHLVRDAGDFRALHVATAAARAIESASDSLARSANMLRDHLLEELART